MLRHTENCNGEVDEDEDENGTPAPKKARRGRKRKMQSRRDEEDTGMICYRVQLFCVTVPEFDIRI